MKYRHQTSKIDNRSLYDSLAVDPCPVIVRAEHIYAQAISGVCDNVVGAHKQIILLTGPSASGKTTTAHRISYELRRRAKKVNLISLDNFYKDARQLPTWDDGYLNYESVEGLDTALLDSCLQTLLSLGRADFPEFDFSIRSRAAHTLPLTFDEETYLIIEGIHALNPLISDMIHSWNHMKLYISVHSDFTEGGQREVLCARDLRLIRRIIRDCTYRSSPIGETLKMWDYVLRGEQLYMHPYRENADVHIDSTHAYEPYLYYDEIIRELDTITKDSPFWGITGRLRDAVSHFYSIDQTLAPSYSLLREFIGQ